METRYHVSVGGKKRGKLVHSYRHKRPYPVLYIHAALLIPILDLTGTQPAAVSSTLAGTTHDLKLETNYYTTTVPVWLDLITVPEEWAGSFLTEEAKEVLEVLGGVMVIFAIPSGAALSSPCKDLIREVGKVVKEGLGGWEWDGVTLAVGVGEVDHLDDLDTWDEVCGDAGLEFVHVASSVASDSKNEFGGELIWEPYVEDWIQLTFVFFAQKRLAYLGSSRLWSRMTGRLCP